MKFLGGDKKLLRQRRWQIRKHAEGKCEICGKKKVTAFLCLKHAVYLREYQRRRGNCKSRKDSLTYRLERGKK